MGGLSVDQVKFVQTLADLSYGTGIGEGVNGGKGNMGLLYDSDGKMHVIKCNTHFSQAKNIQKEISADRPFSDKHNDIITASNMLRAELVKLGKSVGMDEEAISDSLGGIDPYRKLLTRTAVAKFVTKLKDVVSENAKAQSSESPQAGCSDDVSENAQSGELPQAGCLDDVWKNVHATKSAMSMSFKNVQASKVEGHNATVFTAEQVTLREAKDFFLSRSRMNGGTYRTLDKLAKRMEDALELSLQNGTVSHDVLDLAKNYKSKFEAVGLKWLIEANDRGRFYTVAKNVLKDQMKGLDCDGLQERVIDYYFMRNCKIKLNDSLETMLTTGEPTFEYLLNNNIESIGTGPFFQGRPMFAYVRNAIDTLRSQKNEVVYPGYQSLDGSLRDSIARTVWNVKFDSEWGVEQLELMCKNGQPTFSEIVKMAVSELEKPFREKDGAPLEAIRNALGDRIVDLDKEKADSLAQNIWKGGLSEAFASRFKSMMETGDPTFKALVEEVASDDLEELKNASNGMWDELESVLSGEANISEETKVDIRASLVHVRELVAKKDDIIAGLKQAFESLKNECESAGQPLPEWDTFLSRGGVLFNVFNQCGMQHKDWSWHETRTSTTTTILVSMFESFANFPALYAEVKEKGAVVELLRALAETGCAQARLDALQMFLERLRGSTGATSVEHAPNETPQVAIMREIEHAAKEVRAEKKIANNTPIPFSDIEKRLKENINGMVFAGVLWSKHQLYTHLDSDEAAKQFHITFSTKEISDFFAVKNDDHLAVWD